VDLAYWNGKVVHMGRIITNLGNLGMHLPERSDRFLNPPMGRKKSPEYRNIKSKPITIIY
jgi:hypothetical protein